MSKEGVAQALKQCRQKAGMTCKQVASIIGKSEKTVSAWENCNGQPDADMLLWLCEIYQVENILDIFGRDKIDIPKYENEGKSVVATSSIVTIGNPEEIALLEKYRRLTPEHKGRIDERIEIYLEKYSEEIYDDIEAKVNDYRRELEAEKRERTFRSFTEYKRSLKNKPKR